MFCKLYYLEEILVKFNKEFLNIYLWISVRCCEGYRNEDDIV